MGSAFGEPRSSRSPHEPVGPESSSPDTTEFSSPSGFCDSPIIGQLHHSVRTEETGLNELFPSHRVCQGSKGGVFREAAATRDSSGTREDECSCGLTFQEHYHTKQVEGECGGCKSNSGEVPSSSPPYRLDGQPIQLHTENLHLPLLPPSSCRGRLLDEGLEPLELGLHFPSAFHGSKGL